MSPRPRKAFFLAASAAFLATFLMGCDLISQPQNPAVSLEQAIEIAKAYLDSRGLEAAFSGHSGMDRERGRWVWDIEFRSTRFPTVKYEIYVDVETGAVVKFKTD